MKATTHTEVYRRFDGQLARWPLRPWVLATSALRGGFKQRLPALLLFAPIAISMIVHSFKVHLSYTMPELMGEDPRAQLGGAMVASVLGRAVENVLSFLEIDAFFGLLVIAWYGSGLIAEDRRLGANLLYFSRPLTRFGYLGGKFLAAFVFGALATTVPALEICSVAAFSSENWAFLREEWDAVLAAIGLTMIWSATVAIVVLTISSLVKRKTHALVGIVGLIVLTAGTGNGLRELMRDQRFTLLDLFANFSRLGDWMLRGEVDPDMGIAPTLYVLAALWVACLAILGSRLRRMEVVA